MKTIIRTPLHEIRLQELNAAVKDQNIQNFAQEKEVLKEQVATLGTQLAQEKFANVQKDAIIGNLGTQVAQVKIEMMLLKGGER